MCTVTFIPVRDAVYITSNRDEKNWRTPALAPEVYPFASGKIIFPRDGDAGGTWIAMHENGNAIVLLNGAFEIHTPEPPYRKSRGLVLLDLISSTLPADEFNSIDLENIEPFTVIIWQTRQLFECRWDGNKKFHRHVAETTPHIWSSATLYGPVISEKRSKWFKDWIGRTQAPKQDDILHFHQFTGDGDKHNDLMMNRDGKVSTVSITSIRIDEWASMQYLDVVSGTRYSKSFLPENLMAGK